MISTIYVERGVRSHPRTRRVLERLPKATVIECDHYGEVFNRRQQSFRLQKRQPSLILAHKSGELVHPTPVDYGVGGASNFYFSHMLNCPYDCRYCFLQGMFRSAHQVLFVNYEDFFAQMFAVTEQHDGDSWFFSGYDCDSLAFEGISGFVSEAMDFLSKDAAMRRSAVDDRARAFVELRTKSASIAPLLEREPVSNVIVAYSLSPAEVADNVEHRAPSLARRLAALVKLQEHGYQLGLRFDPLLWSPNAVDLYRGLFEEVFAVLRPESIHSVSLGLFRLPKDFQRRLVKLYPKEPLLAMPFEDNDGMVSYREDLGRELFDSCREELLGYISDDQYFPMLS